MTPPSYRPKSKPLSPARVSYPLERESNSKTVMSGSSSRSVELEVSFLETFTPNEHEAGDGDGDGHPIGDAKGTRTTINGTAYRVAWKGTFTPGFMLRSERVQEFVEYVAADGSVWTRYSNWETFGGLLGYVLPREQIVAGFQKWTTGLKEAVEGEGQQGKMASTGRMIMLMRYDGSHSSGKSPWDMGDTTVDVTRTLMASAVMDWETL
ncbi:hypothetical protein NPX13_g5234 [Xylaria arbuscula]|uniref:Uncharacterized protein n=1 Tax=Xylaria arbuscula TaxID=114810 RepID=A0A9W8NEZ8_9PEZI|nr:hypothetical protein NPX13_g5234 [Xylaria arbuscula]